MMSSDFRWKNRYTKSNIKDSSKDTTRIILQFFLESEDPKMEQWLWTTDDGYYHKDFATTDVKV